MRSIRFIMMLVAPLIISQGGCTSAPTRSEGGSADTSSGPSAGATVSPVLAGETLTLNVAGLSCPQCASNIDRTVGRVKGVSGVEVDLGAGQVHVTMLPGQRASEAQIEQAVRDAGFEVVP